MKIFICLSVISCFLFSSCVPLVFVAGAAIGAGTIAYIKGESTRDYYADYEKVWEASCKAISDMQFTLEKTTRDVLKGFIDAKMADATPVKIAVEKKNHITTVKIRVGLFGNEEISAKIHEKIEQNLKK